MGTGMRELPIAELHVGQPRPIRTSTYGIGESAARTHSQSPGAGQFSSGRSGVLSESDPMCERTCALRAGSAQGRIIHGRAVSSASRSGLYPQPLSGG